jgi:ferredoxin
LLRKIITIDEELCNGCGLCIPNCPEGALQVIDGKARLVSDLFCDGLGACVGQCPEGAMTVLEREAEPYDERKVMANIVNHGENTIVAHLEHLREHGEMSLYREAVDYLREEGLEVHERKPEVPEWESETTHDLPCGCPGSMVSEFNRDSELETGSLLDYSPVSRLTHWPVQIKLLPVNAPYFQGADLLLAADCVPFAYPGFHDELLAGKVLLVGCPKLDDASFYLEKITEIVKTNDIKSVTCVHMEVPCCFGLPGIARQAIEASGRDIPFHDLTVTVNGRIGEALPA